MQISLKYVFVLLILGMISCKDDDDGHMDDHKATTPEYSIQVMSPSAEAKMLGDTIHIHVNFDEANMTTVHHVNVKIHREDDESIVMYDGPMAAHVHDEDGHYELHADVILNATNNVTADTDWVLEAKVWGHEAGAAEVIDNSRKFHVHPN